jgi:perosamine synthetase
MSTGDGGMLTTENAELDSNFRVLRQHGMSVPDTIRHGSPRVIFEQHSLLGYNYRMTDIQAAVGREQLKRLPEIVAARRSLAGRYARLLNNNIGLVTPSEPDYARSNWQSYCVRLPGHCDQRAVMQIMLDAGIATRRGIMCSHREAVYAEAPLRVPLPHSEAAQDQCIILPLYPQMTAAEQEQVATVLKKACTIQ